MKSILHAWVRIACLSGIVAGGCGLAVEGSYHSADATDMLACGGVTVVSAAELAYAKLDKSVTHAGYARACQLAKLAKVSDRAMAALAAAYGNAPVSYGFTPLPVSDNPEVWRTILVEEIDEEPQADEPSGISNPVAATPRHESRRHG